MIEIIIKTILLEFSCKIEIYFWIFGAYLKDRIMYLFVHFVQLESVYSESNPSVFFCSTHINIKSGDRRNLKWPCKSWTGFFQRKILKLFFVTRYRKQ